MRLLFLFLTSSLAAEVIAVGHKHSDSVGFYDSTTGRLIQTTAVGHKPHEMVLSADGKRLFVANYGLTRWTEPEPGGNTITVIDTGSRQVTGTIDLGAHHRPHGIERSASGRIFVVTGRPGALHIVDPTSLKILTSYPLHGKDPHMVAVLPDESKAYIANASSGDLTVLSLKTSMPQKHLGLGGIPMGLTLTRDGKTLYATNRSGDAVAVIDTATDRITQFIAVPGEPVRCRLIKNDEVLLVTTIVSGDVVMINTRSKQIFHRQHAGRQLEGIAVDDKEQNFYVSAQEDNIVHQFSVGRYRIEREIKTANRPDPIVVLR